MRFLPSYAFFFLFGFLFAMMLCGFAHPATDHTSQVPLEPIRYWEGEL